MENSASTTRKKNYRRKPRTNEDTDAAVDGESPATSMLTSTAEEPTSETIEDLLEIRRMRKRTPGMDTQKLQAPLEKKKKKTENKKDGSKTAVTSHDAAASAETEKKSTLAFTGQTNIVDVDKHMMAYIEKEMRKRKTDKSTPTNDTENRDDNHDDNSDNDNDDEEEKDTTAPNILDPFYALYVASEQAKMNINKNKDKEGSLTSSSTMLTQVQEVDLGMDARLRNIEETERAKRKLQEDAKSSNIMNNVPSHRFFQHRLNIQSSSHSSDQQMVDRFRKIQRRR
ncbi:hepatocellular carcinoma-associated antigen 59-domain-containing protein [Syncephalis fuscata]|nr:hepatocellular carcinoma-associated antigen 59-domain-containing protein [Syncephalis fuscata]